MDEILNSVFLLAESCLSWSTLLDIYSPMYRNTGPYLAECRRPPSLEGKLSQMCGTPLSAAMASIPNSPRLSFWLGLGSASEASTACQEATASPVQLAQETAPTCQPREWGFDVAYCSDSTEDR